MTLTFAPLSLNMCGRSGIMQSTYVPNWSEINESAAELLMSNDRFFVRFRGCSNLSIGDLKNEWTDLHQIWWDVVRSLLHTEFKNGEDILLGLQTTAAQIRVVER